VILIFCAFGAELQPLLRLVRDRQTLDVTGISGCYGRIGNTQVALATSGIGMRQAAASAQRAFSEIHGIDLAVLTGVAGALVDNLQIGDVVLADRLMARADNGAQAGRAIDVPPHHRESVAAALVAARIECARGAILTVKYPLATQVEKRFAGEQSGAIAVDMETAVIAFEAAERRIPFVAIRTIMDTVEHDLAGARLADENGKVRPVKAAAMLVRNPVMVAGVIRLVRNLRKATDSMAAAVEAVVRRLE
jgi:adenosylhomocysteine nucleosidase